MSPLPCFSDKNAFFLSPFYLGFLRGEQWKGLPATGSLVRWDDRKRAWNFLCNINQYSQFMKVYFPPIQVM